MLLLPLLSVSAEYFSSNELGQKKSAAVSIPDDEWVLSVDGDKETLYHNGEVYFEKIYTSSGWTLKKAESEEKVIKNSDGNTERRIITTPGGTEEYNYIYAGTLLKGYNYSLNGTLLERVDYVTTGDGTLLYYSLKDEGVYLTDRYFVTGGEKTAYEDSPSVTTKTEDGYAETDGDGTRYYDNNGRLIKEEAGGEVTAYTYSDDGILIEKSVERDDGTSVTYYEEEGERVRRYSSSGVLLSERRLLEDGTTEERRFIDGVAKYVFIYDTDGKRIKEAYAL